MNTPIVITVLTTLGFLISGCGGDSADGGANLPRGVTDNEIRIGMHTDLSGPVASWGFGTSSGMRLRFDEANAAGGIHGRKIKLFIEDSHYQVPPSVKATNKLLDVDKVFLMVGSLGTPQNLANFKRMFDAGVPSLFPLTAAVQMYEPLHPMKFSYMPSYRDQVRGGMKYMTQLKNYNKVCLQVVANDYGAENETGYMMGVQESGLESVYTGSHKTTESDFIGTVTAIKNSGCQLLVLGPMIKDSILLYTALRDAGWGGDVIGNMVPYTTAVASANNGGMDGFYAISPFNLADFKAEVKAQSWVGDWYKRYKLQFGQEPNVQAEAGYLFASVTVKALELAGRELTTEKVLKAIESIKNFPDPFGGSSVSFGPEKHQGGDTVNLYQVRGVKWALAQANIAY